MFKVKGSSKDFTDVLRMSIIEATASKIRSNMSDVIDTIFDLQGAKFLKDRMKVLVTQDGESIYFNISIDVNNYLQLESILEKGGKLRFIWRRSEKSSEEISKRDEAAGRDLDKSLEFIKSLDSINDLMGYKMPKIPTESVANNFSKGEDLFESLIMKSMEL